MDPNGTTLDDWPEESQQFAHLCCGSPPASPTRSHPLENITPSASDGRPATSHFPTITRLIFRRAPFSPPFLPERRAALKLWWKNCQHLGR